MGRECVSLCFVNGVGGGLWCIVFGVVWGDISVRWYWFWFVDLCCVVVGWCVYDVVLGRKCL